MCAETRLQVDYSYLGNLSKAKGKDGQIHGQNDIDIEVCKDLRVAYKGKMQRWTLSYCEPPEGSGW